MTFNSLQFALFFSLLLLAYYRLQLRGQNRLIFVAGSIFYAYFDWRFLGLLYLSTVVDFAVGRQLGRTEDARSRNALLGTSLVAQLGVLGLFKYFNFFSTSAADLLDKAGLSLEPRLLHIVLPVGISFYTFQTLAYVFAVHRRQLDAETNFFTFAAFVSWVPQLVAGPIERATSLLPQLRTRRTWPTAAIVESGCLLILRGLFKKVVIADGVAAFVNTVYASPGVYSWGALTLATVGFAVQVYGDFSGYSDIARGCSRLLGVELRWNFEQPFLSRDMREFWQRWHTSLGWWFTEHVGRPLGGAERGRARAALNVLIIFGLIGLWHGPAWTFVVWGLFNGVLVVIWRNLPTPRGQHPMKLRFADVPRIALTFLLFCVGVVFFRASSFADAGTTLARIAGLDGGLGTPIGAELVPMMLMVTLVLDIAERRRRVAAIEQTRTRAQLGGVATPGEAALESPIFALGSMWGGAAIAAMVIAIIVFSGGAPTPFIYFQF